MKYQVALSWFLFEIASSSAHEHEAETAKSLDAWASVPVITHWGDTAVYIHAFFMSIGTLVLLPAGTPKTLDGSD
jgi:hypothetical protein